MYCAGSGGYPLPVCKFSFYCDADLLQTDGLKKDR